MDYVYDVYWCDLNTATDQEGLVVQRYDSLPTALITAEHNSGIVVPTLHFKDMTTYRENDEAVDRIRHKIPTSPSEFNRMRAEVTLDTVSVGVS